MGFPSRLYFILPIAFKYITTEYFLFLWLQVSAWSVNICLLLHYLDYNWPNNAWSHRNIFDRCFIFKHRHISCFPNNYTLPYQDWISWGGGDLNFKHVFLVRFFTSEYQCIGNSVFQRYMLMWVFFYRSGVIA